MRGTFAHIGSVDSIVTAGGSEVIYSSAPASLPQPVQVITQWSSK